MLKEGRKQSNHVNSFNKLHHRGSPTFFAFCERRTGTTRFVVEAAADGSVPFDQAASLLAMHCLVRGQAPDDYMMMVSAGDELSAGIAVHAEKLLEAGRSISSPLRLSRREEEVLRGVCQNLANKEIAAGLNISERTVKFHVSALLAKFGVHGRVELMREAAQILAANGSIGGAPVAFPAPSREAWGSALERRSAGPPPQTSGQIQPAPPRSLLR
jgi:DNA-binding CsgD family transcriptional regulator